MAGVQRFAVGGLTAAAIIDALMPNYALGQQVSKTDDRIDASYQTVAVPAGERNHQRIPGASGERRHAKRDALEAARDSRGSRKSRSESAYRGHCTPPRPGELHGVRAGRIDHRGRLSRRRLQGRPDVCDDRQSKDDGGFRRRRALAKIAPPLHGKDRRHRFLLMEAISPTPWRSGWDRILRQRYRSMAPYRARKTSPRFRRQSWRTMVSWTRGWRVRGRRSTVP